MRNLGKMGIVGVRYSGTMEIVAVGRDVSEMQDGKGWLREEDMHVGEDYSIRHAI